MQTVDYTSSLAAAFVSERFRLGGMAHRLLGSAVEAEDALQDAWARLHWVESGSIDNPAGWLTTVVSRIALDMLRSRRSRTMPGARPVPLPGRVTTPRTGSIRNVIRPDDATGNFIKVAQRIPVRIAIDPQQPSAERLSPAMSVTAHIQTKRT